MGFLQCLSLCWSTAPRCGSALLPGRCSLHARDSLEHPWTCLGLGSEHTFYIFYKTSSEHTLVLQMRPKWLSPGVQEELWPHSWESSGLSHVGISPTEPSPVPAPHNIIHNWCWCIACRTIELLRLEKIFKINKPNH